MAGFPASIDPLSAHRLIDRKVARLCHNAGIGSGAEAVKECGKFPRSFPRGTTHAQESGRFEKVRAGNEVRGLHLKGIQSCQGSERIRSATTAKKVDRPQLSGGGNAFNGDDGQRILDGAVQSWREGLHNGVDGIANNELSLGSFTEVGTFRNIQEESGTEDDEESLLNLHGRAMSFVICNTVFWFLLWLDCETKDKLEIFHPRNGETEKRRNEPNRKVGLHAAPHDFRLKRSLVLL